MVRWCDIGSRGWAVLKNKGLPFVNIKRSKNERSVESEHLQVLNDLFKCVRMCHFKNM